MEIQARRISGSTFSSEDKLEILFNSNGESIASVMYTIDLISGVNVTHGGGGQPNEYLHYKNADRDADSNGSIDYSSIEMALVQEGQGISAVKVAALVITEAAATANQTLAHSFKTEMDSWYERRDVALALKESFTVEAPVEPQYTAPVPLSTSEIELRWENDVLV